MSCSAVRERHDAQGLINDLRVLDDFFQDNPGLCGRCLNAEGYLLDNAQLRGISRTADLLAMRIHHALDEVLISDKGQLNGAAVAFLKYAGFEVEVTSRDRYGPLGAHVLGPRFKVGFG